MMKKILTWKQKAVRRILRSKELGKKARWLRRIKDDTRAWKLATIALLKEEITIQEWERVLYGRLVQGSSFAMSISMILLLSKKVAYLEEEIRRLKDANYRGKSENLRAPRELEKAVREAFAS